MLSSALRRAFWLRKARFSQLTLKPTSSLANPLRKVIHNEQVSFNQNFKSFSLSSQNSTTELVLSQNEFEQICEETLESLCENFELLLENHSGLKGCDVTLSDGVLTLCLNNHGTYVINRQTPNKQIWLSSPRSGPKRYDFSVPNKTWVYKHDNVSMHSLLQKELTDLLQKNVDLSKCSYSVCKD